MSFEKELTQELHANVDDLVLQSVTNVYTKVLKVQYIIGMCVYIYACMCLRALVYVHACIRAVLVCVDITFTAAPQFWRPSTPLLNRDLIN